MPPKRVLLVLAVLLTTPLPAQVQQFTSASFASPSWQTLPEPQRAAITRSLDAWVERANQLIVSTNAGQGVSMEQFLAVYSASPKIKGPDDRSGADALLSALPSDYLIALVDEPDRRERSSSPIRMQAVGAIASELVSRLPNTERTRYEVIRLKAEFCATVNPNAMGDRLVALTTSPSIDPHSRRDALTMLELIRGFESREGIHSAADLFYDVVQSGNLVMAARIGGTAISLCNDHAYDDLRMRIGLDQEPLTELVLMEFLADQCRHNQARPQLDWLISRCESLLARQAGLPSETMARVIFQRGRLSFSNNNFEAAELDFMNAIEIGLGAEDAPTGLYFVGRCRQSRGDYDGMELFYELALEHGESEVSSLAQEELAIRAALNSRD